MLKWYGSAEARVALKEKQLTSWPGIFKNHLISMYHFEFPSDRTCVTVIWSKSPSLVDPFDCKSHSRIQKKCRDNHVHEEENTSSKATFMCTKNKDIRQTKNTEHIISAPNINRLVSKTLESCPLKHEPRTKQWNHDTDFQGGSAAWNHLQPMEAVHGFLPVFPAPQMEV